MKRTLLKFLCVAAILALAAAFLSSCESLIVPIEPESEMNSESYDTGSSEETSSTDESLTEAVANTESDTTRESSSEDESVTETSETWERQPETSVYEEVIFGGEFTLPETTEKAPDIPSYAPSYPIGDGRAPLALMYHLILDEPYSSLENLFVRPSELEGHIEALLEAGYTFIFADEYGLYDTKTVIMSFDDGYTDNYTEMFPIIKKYNVKVTVFMIAGYIGGENFMNEDMIREMSSSGLVSFQSHTQNHANLTSLSAEQLRDEFSSSCRNIEALTGREVRAVCYPSGRYNETVLRVAGEFFDFGYTTVSRSSTAGYPSLELPRLRVNRGFSKDYFSRLIP